MREENISKSNEINTNENRAFERVQPEPSKGLSEHEVMLRMEAGADNRKVKSATKSVSEIVKSNVFTYFNLVFLIIAVLLAIVGAWRDMLFLPIIISNTCIGIVQELHSKRVLDKLSILNAPRTRAVRDGRVLEVDSEKLVLDDIVIFETGAQIPADAVVVEGEMAVNEALITGESDEITKRPGDAVMSGSFVVSGEARARLEAVGRDSYISKLTLQATESSKGEQSEMIRCLNNLIMVMGIIILPIGTALFVQSFFINEQTLRDSVTGMVAAILGMIPEGLYLLASVAMAVSTVRLAQKKVLVHDMKCIETLARVNVLCVDKTGTITESGMQVYEYVDAEGKTCDGPNSPLFAEISDMAANMPADNSTMEAMKAYFTGASGRHPVKMVPFSSRTKFSGVQFQEKCYVLGAPEFVLKEKAEDYREIVESYSSKGYRVLVFAEYDGELDGEPLKSAARARGFVMLANPIRRGAAETFQYFGDNQVEIKVISGDNPLTVSVIAQEAGIAGAENYIDAQSLRSEQDYYNAVDKYTVFGRVTPDQKKFLIQAIKKRKRTVAMVGDGVNDVLALKCADCSVAMASGSDAASNVSQLVLLDSDFGRMPSVVMEGRRVVNNIQRSASLFIVKNIFSMLLAIFSVLLMLDYPLEPSQVSLISMFTIGIPSFILALEPNRQIIKGHFLTNVMVKALPAGVTDFVAVSSLVLFCREFSVDPVCVSTSCTILVAIVGFMILYRIAQPMTVGHICMMVGLVAGWLFCLLFVSQLFAITSISKQCTMLMVVFVIATEPVLRYLSRFVEWTYERWTNWSLRQNRDL